MGTIEKGTKYLKKVINNLYPLFHLQSMSLLSVLSPTINITVVTYN